MSPEVTLLLYVCVFVGVLLLIEGVAQLVGLRTSRSEQAINRRLQMLSKGMNAEEVLKLLRRDTQQRGLARLALWRSFSLLVMQSGTKLKPVMIAAIAILVGVIVFWIADIGLERPAAALIALIIAILGPVLILRFIRSRRLKRLQEQLPDAIDLMVRSLRAGHPLSTSFQTIAGEMADPIGTELGIVSDEITYGEDLTDAIMSMARRSGSEDCYYLAVAISIQHGTGGNLSSVLETLSRVIRERFAMERKIKAVSAEGRMTAWIVSSIPVLLVAGLMLMMPSFYLEVMDDPIFWPMMYTGAILTVTNAVILRKLVNFHF